MKISDFGRDFLLLALRIGKHNKDYVDYYIGPKEISDWVDREELVSPKKLLDECKKLQKELFVQGYHKKRERYIEKILTAMQTSVETLNGIFIPFKEKFLRLYDIELQPVNPTELDNLRRDVYEAFGGSGGLEKNLTEIRKSQKIHESEIFSLFNKALHVTKNRTKELFIKLLPENEQVKIELVRDDVQNWTIYNKYLGNFCSRINININFDIYLSSLLINAAHEGYPGHHTEFIIKEGRLYKELNHYEHSILLLNSPKLLVSEGIADLGINMLFSYQDQSEVTLQKLDPNLSIRDSIEKLTLQNKVKGKIHLFWFNLAYLALIEGWDSKKLERYALDFEFYDEKIIKSRIRSFSDDVFSITRFAYKIGRDLITRKFSEFPSINNFKFLLENSVLPSDLV